MKLIKSSLTSMLSMTLRMRVTVLMQSSALAFWIVKLIGGAYLIWLGIRALRAQNLVNFAVAEALPLKKIFLTGFLSAALNPKPGLFVLAFIPQFVSPERGSVAMQMWVYGAWFATLTAAGFAIMGVCASSLTSWLSARPRWTQRLNNGAGLTFILSGLSVITIKQK